MAHDKCYDEHGYFNCGCDEALLRCVGGKRNIRTPKGRAAIAVWNYFCGQYTAHCHTDFRCH